MSNPKDSGRYDATTDTWIDQNVRIDFAWGNVPMQPNDDRGMAQLDPELDSHVIATSSYEGFPAFTPGDPFDDTIPNVEVPNLVGLTNPTAAQAALEAVGLVLGDTNPDTAGANSGNNNKVKSQSVAAGTLVNVGSTVSIVVFNNPQALVPNISGLAWMAANTAITNAGFTVGTSVTDVNTDNISIANTVASQSPAAGTYANVGSAISYHLYNYVPAGYTSGTGDLSRAASITSMMGQNFFSFAYAYAGSVNDASSALYAAAANNGLVGHTIDLSGVTAVGIAGPGISWSSLQSGHLTSPVTIATSQVSEMEGIVRITVNTSSWNLSGINGNYSITGGDVIISM